MIDSLTLPGCDNVAAERASANGELQAERISQTLKTPIFSISKISGDLEKHSPLFRDSEANSQGRLF